MPGDWTRRVNVGDDVRLQADWYNAATEAAAAFRRNRQPAGAGHLAASVPEGLILIRNDGSDDVDRFGILGISGALVGPDDDLQQFQGAFALTGVTPTTADHTGRFVIAQQPIRSGMIGAAWAFGVCPVQIDIQDVTDTTADVADGDATRLVSGKGIAQLLYAPSGTGTQWCLVRFGGAGGDQFPPGEPRQVFQRDDNRKVVCDWVQAP